MVAEKEKKAGNYDLSIYGVRKTEGGARASAYKNCFTAFTDECDEYRPIFWYKNETKRLYEEHYGVKHSRCYSEYGLKRTGCAGCPFGRDFEDELSIMDRYEPKFYKAALAIFGASYEYTRQYREFILMKKEQDI